METTDKKSGQKNPENQSQTLLKDLSLKYFGQQVTSGFQILGELKSKLFYAFPQANSQLNNYFVPVSDAQLIMIYDLPLISRIDSWVKSISQVNANSAGLYDSVKEYYNKWLFSPDTDEKRRAGEELQAICSRNFDERMFSLYIYYALYLIYDNPLNPRKEAAEVFLKAERVIERLMNIDEGLKTTALHIVFLLSGYYYIKVEDYPHARRKLNEALKYNPSSVSAKYYLAVTEVKTGNPSAAMEQIREIFYFDSERVHKAIDNHNLLQFSFFVKNAETLHIFRAREFEPLASEIDSFFRLLADKVRISAGQLKNVLAKLKSLNLEEFYSEELANTINIIDRITLQYPDSTHLIILTTVPYLHEKLKLVIQQLNLLVKENYHLVMNRKITKIDLELMKHNNAIRQLQKAVDESKLRHKDGLERAVRELEHKMEETLSLAKDKLQNLDKIEKYQPAKSFAGIMTMDVIISLSVFLISGIAALTSEAVKNESSQLKEAIVSGSKWGAVTFALGIIIACFMAFLTLISRGRERQRLQWKVRHTEETRRQEKDRLKARLQKELNEKLSGLNQRMEEHRNEAQKLENVRKEEERKLKAEASAKMKEIQQKLQEVWKE